VGKISKQWAGLLREAFTDADYFGITFPMDLDVKMKAVMIGACFLIVSTDVGARLHLLLLYYQISVFVVVSAQLYIMTYLSVVTFSVSVWEL
jgi:hypothetical protein